MASTYSTVNMHLGLFLLGCFLSLFAQSNGLPVFEVFTYSEVKNPTTEDRKAFIAGVAELENKIKIPFKSTSLISLYRKNSIIWTSYKAYFGARENLLCYIKWRVWPGKYTMLSDYSCDMDNSLEEEDNGGEDGKKERQSKKAIANHNKTLPKESIRENSLKN